MDKNSGLKNDYIITRIGRIDGQIIASVANGYERSFQIKYLGLMWYEFYEKIYKFVLDYTDSGAFCVVQMRRYVIFIVHFSMGKLLKFDV